TGLERIVPQAAGRARKRRSSTRVAARRTAEVARTAANAVPALADPTLAAPPALPASRNARAPVDVSPADARIAPPTSDPHAIASALARWYFVRMLVRSSGRIAEK